VSRVKRVKEVPGKKEERKIERTFYSAAAGAIYSYIILIIVIQDNPQKA
jgi:hypothetical protein